MPVCLSPRRVARGKKKTTTHRRAECVETGALTSLRSPYLVEVRMNFRKMRLVLATAGLAVLLPVAVWA